MIYGGGKRLVRCCPYQSNKEPSWTYSWYKCSSLTNNIEGTRWATRARASTARSCGLMRRSKQFKSLPILPSPGSFRCTVYHDGDVAAFEELNTIFIPVILILVWSLLWFVYKDKYINELTIRHCTLLAMFLLRWPFLLQGLLTR